MSHRSLTVTPSGKIFRSVIHLWFPFIPFFLANGKISCCGKGDKNQSIFKRRYIQFNTSNYCIHCLIIKDPWHQISDKESGTGLRQNFTITKKSTPQMKNINGNVLTGHFHDKSIWRLMKEFFLFTKSCLDIVYDHSEYFNF